ncbi:transcriptional regulator [Flavobacterium sp. J27]|uniref:transcriptional regulator n=1 Tax=Flavobacterium sp. J27 TaxID=2060419 RepID=UPI001031FB94|nr:transcriptional regulator [Flavobacterium sp. J27]
MNYIKHLTGFFEKVSIDYDLNPTHISLYMAIFQLWNQNRFQNPISISRDELMRISKIASTATYHKCIKELAERDYIIYKPSYNPFRGSLLEVCNLDFYTKPVTKKEIKKLTAISKNEKVIEQVINKHQTSNEHVPIINNTNSINIKKDNTQNSKKEKNESKFSKPLFEETKNYFLEKNIPEYEAEKFYNYYESNGWLIGGKTKMKDWKAAARNWMINAKKFDKNSSVRTDSKTYNLTPNQLHVSNHKNYDEAL